jgi:hypothetical protein
MNSHIKKQIIYCSYRNLYIVTFLCAIYYTKKHFFFITNTFISIKKEHPNQIRFDVPFLMFLLNLYSKTEPVTSQGFFYFKDKRNWFFLRNR